MIWDFDFFSSIKTAEKQPEVTMICESWKGKFSWLIAEQHAMPLLFYAKKYTLLKKIDEQLLFFMVHIILTM